MAGFVAMLLAGAAYIAAGYGFSMLPYDVRWITDDQRLLANVTSSLLIGLIIWLALWLTRPRSLAIPLVAVVYAFGARTIGSVGTDVAYYFKAGFPLATLEDRTWQAIAELPLLFRASTTFWPGVAMAAAPAFLLTLLRVLRLRRRDRAGAFQPDPVPAHAATSGTPGADHADAPGHAGAPGYSGTPGQPGTSAHAGKDSATTDPAAVGSHDAFRRPAADASTGQPPEAQTAASSTAVKDRAGETTEEPTAQRPTVQRPAEERGAFEPLQPPARRPVPDMFAPPREPGD
ncbi:hypothetical protein ACIBEJ_38420 [Nonomuraea sp. NPDC050790]|uniref:hypothetical protein n=1 Tax=Nonomuraea sp. NPDC050790 TaxID=3364371 RepID=UPI0037BBB9A0